jgi:hypothetical protein
VEWQRWIPGGEAIGWASLLAGIGATARLLPRAGRWFVGLLIANVRLAMVMRERDVLRETVNQLLAERERLSQMTSGSALSPASSPNSSASTLAPIPKP